MSNVAQWVTVFVGGAVTLIGVAYGAYSHFQTDSEAIMAHTDLRADLSGADNSIRAELAQYQQSNYKAFKSDRIDRHKREIKRYEYRLLSEQLTTEQRDYIKAQIKELNDTIKCIREDRDPC